MDKTYNVWYATGEYMAQNTFSQHPDAITLNETHFQVPKDLCPEVPDEYADDTHDFLEYLFRYFNWIQTEGAAPDEMNAFAREKELHASMSVGDIVEINNIYHVCTARGWQKMSPGRVNALYINKTVNVPR